MGDGFAISEILQPSDRFACWLGCWLSLQGFFGVRWPAQISKHTVRQGDVNATRCTAIDPTLPRHFANRTRAPLWYLQIVSFRNRDWQKTAYVSVATAILYGI